MVHKMSRELNRETREKIASELNLFIDFLAKKYDVNPGRVLGMCKEEGSQEIPTCIFNRKLSSLESIVKYLKENIGLNYKSIAHVLSRNPGSIGITYRNARKKLASKFYITPGIRIPVFIFKNSNLSVLENIVSYLRKQGMSYHEIAVLLKRDDRTIWTINMRAEKKRK